jgi:spermidine/putrescine transport system substrate-binding protein
MSNQQNKYKKILTRVSRKFFIIFIYLVVIAFCLYAPRFADLFGIKKTLNIYAFTEMISPESIKLFEEEMGISVNIKYFESNEELHAKFKISAGEGYDVIVASDYMIQILAQEGLLHRLDHKKLPVIKELDARLLDQGFDAQNNYSLPLAWGTYGLVFNKTLFKKTPEEISLNLLFNNPEENFALGRVAHNYKICMVDDAREAVMFSGLYLFNRVKVGGLEEFGAIQKLLIKQKSWVECYSNSSLQYFLFTNIIPIAITSSAYMKKILESTDQFDFKIPKEGSLLVIESLAIPAACRNVDMVHKFINFMLSEKIATLTSDLYGYNPTNKKSYAFIDKKFLCNNALFPDAETFARLHLTYDYLPRKELENLWFGVKFA